jgi:hypothetical protein
VGKELTFYAGVRGEELKTDDSRAGHIDDGNIAYEPRVTEAARQWPRGRLEDFEPLGRRRWRDRGSGTVYHQVHGAPLLSVGTDATRNISLFLVVDGRLVFLERTDVPEAQVLWHGPVYGAEVVDGKIIRESSS